MTSRNYDFILTVNNTVNFLSGNNLIGVTSGTEGIIANVDVATGNIKVKISNVLQEYNFAEHVVSTIIQTSGGSANTDVIPYVIPAFDSSTVTANAVIDGIAHSTYIAEKNAFTQKPLVRLYTIYYPGEWYPPNTNGNPTREGAGVTWPCAFPLRFAEVRGDTISDLQYRVSFDNIEFIPMPLNSTGLQIDSTGKINDIDITISNFDNLISVLVEEPFLVGNNTANAETATVNGELVGNIDPRTIPGNSLFDQAIVDSRGGNNVAFDFSSTEDVNGTWLRLKLDTRDLLGAVIEIKTTFANFLDFWPEFSTVRAKTGAAIEVYNQMPYRVGDIVTPDITMPGVTVNSIEGNFLILSDVFPGEVDDRVCIINEEADPENFILDTFKINSLDGLDEQSAKFNLTSWLQFFKLQIPKRKFFKNTCPWVYKGDECKYPDNGTDVIVNDPQERTANGFFDITNATVFTQADDICAKNLQACDLRRNQVNFGGFVGTGRTIPR